MTKSQFHIDIENYLKRNYQSKYKVLIEYEEKIPLPFINRKLKRHEILYNPDVVLLDPKNSEIRYIIEIEDGNDPTDELRYKVVFSDYCIQIMKRHHTQYNNPKFIMVIKEHCSNEKKNITEGKKKALNSRLDFLKSFITNLDDEIELIINDEPFEKIRGLIK